MEEHGISSRIIINDYTLYTDYGVNNITAGTIATLPLKMRATKKAGITHGEHEGHEYQCPAQFVMDEHGILIHAERNWLDIDKILKVS